MTCGQAAENLGPRRSVGRSHAPIMTNCLTRVEFNNYKASYFML